MKKCNSCKKEKELSEFYKAARMKDGYMSRCKKCADISSKTSRDKKQEHYASVRRVRKKDLRKQWQEWKTEKGCYFCDETFYACLEPHHIDPTIKETEVSKLIHHSWKKIMEEMDKCVLVCSNCHRKLHHGNLKLNGSVAE